MSNFLDISTEGKEIPQSDRRLSGDYEDRHFRVGQVLSDTFRVFIKNILHNSLYMIITAAPFAIILGGILYSIYTGAVDIGTSEFGEALALGLFFIALLSWYIASQVGIVKSTSDLLSDRNPKVGEMVSLTLTKGLVVIAASLLSYAMIAVGLVLLIIPGIMVSVALYIVVPVIVVEGKGVIESLKRSRELTSGHRWEIFGAFFVLSIFTNVIDAISEMLIGTSAGYIGYTMAAILTFVSLGLHICLVATVYINLRRAKEGVDVSDIAKVFE